MRKCFSPRLAVVLLLVAVGTVVLLWMSGRVGVPAFRLEQDLRSSQHIPENWTVVGTVTEEAAVYLFYPPEQNAYGITVYQNSPGLSFGYFFRGSHTVAGIQGTAETLPAAVEEIPLDGTGLIAYISLNSIGIQRMEQNDGTTVESTPLDSNAPFVLLLPQSAGDTTFYDKNGVLVETRLRGI